MTWTAEKKTIMGFGLVLALIFVVGIVAYYNAQNFIDTNRWVTHTLEVLRELDNVLTSILNAETGQRGFVITGDESHLEPYDVAITTLDEHLQTLRGLTADSPNQQTRLDSLIPVISEKLNFIESVIVIASEEGLEDARQIILSGRGKMLMDQIRAIIVEMEQEENENLALRRAESQKIAEATLLMFVVLIALTTGLLVLTYWLINRNIAALKRTQAALRLSEEQWRSLVENTPDIISTFDLDGTLLYVNRVSGSQPEDAVGKNIYDLVGPSEQRSVLKQAVQRVLESGKSTSYETTSAISGRHFINHLAPIVLDGQVISFITSSTDISERKEAEEQLQQYAEQLQDLYDNAPCGYHSLDKDGVFLQINKTELRWLGYTGDEVIGKMKFSDIITAESLKIFQQNFPAFKERGWVNDLEFEMVRKDGTTFNVLLNATAIRDAAGNYVSSRSTLFDITERKRIDAMFKALLESAPDAMVIVNMAGQIMLVNAQTQQLLGYAADELIGQSIEMLIPHSLRQQHPEHRTHYLTDPHPRPMGAGMELFALCKDDREVPVEISLSPLETEEGMLVISAIRDITGRKQIEAALREQHAELDRFFTVALDLLCIADTDGYFIKVNKAWEHLLGYSVHELQGQRFLDFVHPDDLQPTLDAIATLDEQQPVWKFINRYRSKNGTYRFIEWQSSPQGKRIYAAARDITDHIQTETQIRELNETLAQRATELEAINKELEAFSYSVSHDLRAPLRAIDGFSQALLEDYTDKLDQEGQTYLQRVRIAANRMAELIDDLINLSRITRAEINLRPVNLTELALAIAAELRDREPERQVEFIINEGLVAAGDERLLKVALENLIGNSWKFTSNRPQSRIEVGIFEHSEDGTVFFVRDNGDGFDMDYADKLFGAFQRLHTITEFEGTGIGLATVQRIIHRHGGRVWAEGEVGKGATFYFTFREKVGD